MYLSPDEERAMILHVGGVVLREHLTQETLDGVIGVARGGWVVAQGVAQILGFRNDKLIAASLSLYNGEQKEPDNPVWSQMPSVEEVHDKRWLVFDDLADSGDTLVGLLRRLHEYGARTRTLTLLQNRTQLSSQILHLGKPKNGLCLAGRCMLNLGRRCPA